MISSGRRDTLIAFERAAVTQDGYGGEIPTWSQFAREWAAINWGRGDERRQAAMESGRQPATFTVLDNATTRDVTLRDRIVCDGIWDIESNVPGRQRGERDITAVRGG
ncbi:head-tail adaptor protein [Qipengyuania sp.]|uniref:phage head completion protein n=1 Tax=Qipengyuania sp. TaxID=2004515 RepID=UPI0035C7F1DC